jgi:redox-sensitive bicupin YhaK (pirin superfamily)
MIEIVPFANLGWFRNEWLESRFHFDFAGVAAPMGSRFGHLRVWNDDVIKPQSGFDLHGHRDMEIITYVRRGAISHEDSLGNRGRIPAGDVQVMTAGTGIRHAERNNEDEPTELFQIWVEPERAGLTPDWQQAPFPKTDRAGRMVALASGQKGVKGALPIHQDATLYGALLGKDAELVHDLTGRRAYVVLAEGRVSLDGKTLKARDGAAIEGIEKLELRAAAPSEILLFDLP